MFPTVVLTCDKFSNCAGHSVQISAEKLEKDSTGRPLPNPVYAFTASIGDVSYEHRMTVGSTDEPSPPTLTLAQYQSDVDAARAAAAANAHSRHVISELENQIK